MRNKHLLRGLLVAGILAAAPSRGLAAAAKAAPQAAMAQEVQHALAGLPFYPVFDNLQFHVDGSAVTLTGQVTRPAMKTLAEDAVRSIKGVQRVDDQIETLPLAAADDRIRLAAYTATYGNLLLSQYAKRAVAPVHIIVKNGNVTLEGEVANAMDQELFFTQASGVTGVVSVTDHLKIGAP